MVLLEYGDFDTELIDKYLNHDRKIIINNILKLIKKQSILL